VPRLTAGQVRGFFVQVAQVLSFENDFSLVGDGVAAKRYLRH